jgi:epoxide hydrolase
MTGAERVDAEIRPFRIDVPEAELDELQARLVGTRFTDEIPGSGFDYGVSVEWVRRMVEYWRTGYDWRTWEARLNASPQFTTEIDGQNIHLLHVRSDRNDALALILTHGWPGTVVEYLDVIDDLSKDFHLVIPSLPGFGFSGPTTERGWNRYRTARAWAELMRWRPRSSPSASSFKRPTSTTFVIGWPGRGGPTSCRESAGTEGVPTGYL